LIPSVCQARSVLASSPRNSIKVAYGFNVDWSVGGGRTDMVPAVGLTALQKEMMAAAPAEAVAPAADLDAEAAKAEAVLAVPQTEEEADAEDVASAQAAATAAVATVAAVAEPPPAAVPPPPSYDIVGDVDDEFDPAGASHWLQAAFTVPAEAYEMHLAFSDGTGGNWDNNAGTNFYIRVKMDMTAEQRSHTVERAMQQGPAWGDVQVGTVGVP
jgi:hypothetical protein